MTPVLMKKSLVDYEAWESFWVSQNFAKPPQESLGHISEWDWDSPARVDIWSGTSGRAKFYIIHMIHNQLTTDVEKEYM